VVASERHLLSSRFPIRCPGCSEWPGPGPGPELVTRFFSLGKRREGPVECNALFCFFLAPNGIKGHGPRAVAIIYRTV
jgi:hypothetical protein